MRERDFQGFGRWIKSGSFAAFLDDPGEEVETGSFALPAELLGLAGDGEIFGIAEESAVGLLVGGVAEELVVEDADDGAFGIGGGENGGEGLDFSAVGGEVEVLEEGGVNLVGIGNVAEVADFEGGPEKAADAAGVVAPGHAGAVLEFGKIGGPGAGGFDVAAGVCFSLGEMAGAPGFFDGEGVEEFEGL
jgi:hypothetical protein